MAVKKKEKPTQNKQSEKSDASKASSSAVSRRSAKTDKVKATNPQKMKNGEESKEAKQKAGNVPIMGQVVKSAQFLGEVRAEARKISWPERSQVIRETVSVLFLVTLITVFVWGFDLAVGKFIFGPLEHWAHLYGIGGGA
jgi:preprotein translocase subunit SecE